MAGDALLRFSINQNFANGASQNILDLGMGRDGFNRECAPNIGAGNPVVKVNITGADATGLTGFSCDVEYSDDEKFAKPVKLQTFYADMTDGVKSGTELVSGAISPRKFRYVRLHYTVTGTPAAGAKITAGIYPSH